MVGVGFLLFCCWCCSAMLCEIRHGIEQQFHTILALIRRAVVAPAEEFVPVFHSELDKVLSNLRNTAPKPWQMVLLLRLFPTYESPLQCSLLNSQMFAAVRLGSPIMKTV